MSFQTEKLGGHMAAAVSGLDLNQLPDAATQADLTGVLHDNLVLPGEAGFETLAGFLLFQFGYIPKVKYSVDYGGRRFTITQMDRNRIATVLIEKLDPTVQPDPVNEG